MEWVTMPFGLCKSLATFQRMIDDILRDILHKFVTVYLDDVCVYISRTLKEHFEHMRLVLPRFKEDGLKFCLKKCFFGLQEMEDLGYVVPGGKFSAFTQKIIGVRDWPITRYWLW
jgi:hypothetical protein